MTSEQPVMPDHALGTVQRRLMPSECPACQAALEAVTTLLEQARAAADADERFNWRGICNSHAWQFATTAGLARRLALERLRAAAQHLAAIDATSSGGRGRGKSPPHFNAGGDCPFCSVMAVTIRERLQRWVADAADAAPLCVPHVCLALEIARGRDQVRAVARRVNVHFTALEQDLSELIRKSDYRFRGEPRGPEATSWTRAALLMAGAAGVRWAMRRNPTFEG